MSRPSAAFAADDARYVSSRPVVRSVDYDRAGGREGRPYMGHDRGFAR